MQKHKKGSILAYTLLLLSIMLVSALSLAATVAVGTYSAGDTDRSTQALQLADSGAEAVLEAMHNEDAAIINDLGSCGSGEIEKNSLVENLGYNARYEVTFYGEVDPVTNPEGSKLDCGDSISDIDYIKSLGYYRGVVRALRVGLAQPADDESEP